MAAFIAMISWRGESTDEYFAMPPPDPAVFGISPDDDGSRADPVLSERSRAVTDYQIDRAALTDSTTRILIGVGEESEGLFTGRTAVAVAGLLGQEALVFPSHHGGFAAEDSKHSEPRARTGHANAVSDR